VREETQRGFAIYANVHDAYGTLVRVQKSSSAEEARCWIFCQPHLNLRVPAPHLNVEQARVVRDALTAFIDENA